MQHTMRQDKNIPAVMVARGLNKRKQKQAKLNKRG